MDTQQTRRPNNDKSIRHKPYEGLTLALGKQAGDYRRVGPECWEQLMRLYGGGPAIYVDGPPVEDLSRCVGLIGEGCSSFFISLLDARSLP